MVSGNFIPADTIMRVRLALIVLLSVLPWPLNLQLLCVAEGQTTGFTVEYTLIIANSPDCSLVNNFPLKVQYRTIITGGDGGQNNGVTVSQWMDSPNMPGIYNIHVLTMCNQLIFICIETEIDTSIGCESSLTSSAGDAQIHVTVRSYSLLFPSDVDHINGSQRIQLRLVQSDHRGGFCDCWAVSNLTIRFIASNLEATLM
jgi:hypothetical protein